jgi:hypothetical protein
MRWVKLQNNYTDEPLFGLIDEDDKIRVTCGEDHPPLVKWVAEGNTPTESTPQ